MKLALPNFIKPAIRALPGKNAIAKSTIGAGKRPGVDLSRNLTTVGKAPKQTYSNLAAMRLSNQKTPTPNIKRGTKPPVMKAQVVKKKRFGIFKESSSDLVLFAKPRLATFGRGRDKQKRKSRVGSLLTPKNIAMGVGGAALAGGIILGNRRIRKKIKNLDKLYDKTRRYQEPPIVKQWRAKEAEDYLIWD